MAKVAKALLTNIMKSADAEMRAAMNDEDRKTKFEAIDKKRCESILKLYDQGVSFSAEQPMAISFYTGAATAAVNKKDAALAKKLAAKAEVGIKRLLKQYDTAIERSSGRRKSSLEERRENIQGMLDNLTKKVAALQAPSSDG
jgi:hypothetical protein